MGNGQGPERPRKTRLFRRRANSSLPLTRRFGKTFAPRFFLCNSSDWSGYQSRSLWHQYHSLVFEAKFLEAACLSVDTSPDASPFSAIRRQTSSNAFVDAVTASGHVGAKL